MTLDHEDIDAIASAVFAKIQAAANHAKPSSIVDEVRQMAEAGQDPVAYLKSKFQARKPGKRI
ncbi:MAG: hypothetical protein J0652_02700 [Desulfobulbaceae bacterium]|nr:hypothetical protein [Desulfobulbaceae bacterium]